MIVEAVAALVLQAAPLDTATADERQFAHCVRAHESRGDYRARNGRSSSAGAYQFITKTWAGNAKWAKWGTTYPARKYAQAHHAPAWIQDLVFLHAIRHGGFHAWHGTHCTLNGRLA